MNLFPDENLISETKDKTVKLTSHRICFEKIGFQKADTKSIMLEHITSCESLSQKKYLWLFIAFIGLIMIIWGESDIQPFGGIIGMFGIAAFFLTRKSFIKISSPTANIEINTKGMDRKEVLILIDEIEQTKHKRLLIVGNKTN